MCFLAATVQEEAGDDHAVCQITSERFQKSLQRHLSLYVTAHSSPFLLAPVFKYIPTLTFCPFHNALSLFTTFAFLSSFVNESRSFSPCVISSLPFCFLSPQTMPLGSFWKAQMTTSMQITSMWVCSSLFFSLLSLRQYRCVLLVWGVLGGRLC